MPLHHHHPPAGELCGHHLLRSERAPIRQLVRSEGFTETYSANGRSLTTISTAPVTVTVDPATGGFIFSGSGNQRHLTVPGVGVVLAQPGHQVTDDQGNFISFTGLNIPAGSDFCAALAL